MVIPTFNEEHNIKNTLEDVVGYFRSTHQNFDITVVDDGSTDQTVSLVTHLREQFAELKILQNKINHGKGYVIRQGMNAATGDLVLFMDADNATNIRELTHFTPYIQQGYDIVIGSRRIDSSGVHIDQPLQRRILGSIYIACTRAILGLPKMDYNCGFKLFKRTAVPLIFPKIRQHDWSYDVEIFLIAQINHLKIKEVPVNWKHGGGSKVHPLRDGIKSFTSLLLIKFNEIRGLYS